TNEKYKFYILNDIFEINQNIEKNIIFEPIAKNTAGAILLSLKYLKEKLKISNDELIFITPSDHIIIKENEFQNIVKDSLEYAKKSIVTFGITPTCPHTGYGYIEKSYNLSNYFSKVKRFTEKPDYNTAVKYISCDNYLWNSGMFLFSYKVIMNEFRKHASDMYKFYVNNNFDSMINNFSDLKNISIDYAIMEKSKNLIVAKSDIAWSDIGSWESFSDIMSLDENSNVKVGEIVDINLKNSIIYSNNKKLIALIDINDIIVVNTDDALLIAKKGSGEKVKDIVKYLKEKNNIKAIEHTTVYRPWGSYTVLEEGERYKIKRILVKPNHKLSVQMHYHRSEHWVVIKGTAKVIMSDKEYIVHENESIYVPKSTKHRLENPGKVDLELIEVQNGEYVGEDDIIRFDDVYGRKIHNTTNIGKYNK
ncbi:MAG: mannose-1-phosphate guanylyltransferase/mannose-6-phosphate isomerase, partial [Elusimicrobiales bacterium]|nr:mannose-1-phosphate guanylyltransferase/mannose-6-phosphate isomerase [Elusimicrobiales bacterium]